ncbi:MAG TPA: hypothetical protein DDW31_03250 [candidate division Zixibacteria bacterium]|jgi:hypothetical protein|nr:hypothetical protein [candidate division Zixibacteria bacterium]
MRKTFRFCPAAAGFLAALLAFGQFSPAAPDSVRLAMEQEMERTMGQLGLGELKNPCFAGYTVSDARTLQVTASLGALTRSDLAPQRRARLRLLVGDLKMSNENYMYSGSWTMGEEIPLDDGRRGVRHVLWRLTDSRYKEHAEELENKLAAIAQQNLAPEDTALPDLSPAEAAAYEKSEPLSDWRAAQWEDLARRLSAVFLQYPDLQASQATLYLYQADVRYLNSQGTWARHPVKVCAVVAEAAAQAEDGRELEDRLEFFAREPGELPSEESMARGIGEMAATLSALRTAPLFEESYSGPVLFEGQALAELLAQKFFGGQAGLKAKRKNIMDPSYARSKSSRALENPLESRMDKKVVSRDISVKDVPGMSLLDGQSLIGSYFVDAEGVRPPQELLLVEKGVLRNLLNGRTPTQKVRQSNGHKRLELTANGLAEEIGPGVAVITSERTESYDKLVKRLIKAAKAEDLDYAYIVRRLGGQAPGGGRDQEEAVPAPVVVVRVSVKDGSQTLVRGAEIGSLPLGSLKRVLGAAKGRYVHNTMLGQQGSGRGWGWGLRGVPATLVAPPALLLEEVDMERERRAVTAKLPAVPNPLEK